MHPSLSTKLILAAVVLGIATLPQDSEAAFTWNGTVDAPEINYSTVPSRDAQKCQKRLALESKKYLSKMIRAQNKCMSSSKVAPQDCLTAKDQERLDKSYLKVVELVNKDCSSAAVADGALDNIWTSAPFRGNGSETASCLIGQVHAIAEVVSGNTSGIGLELGIDDRDLKKCTRRVASEGIKVSTGAITAISMCMGKQIKQGTAGDLGPVCFGSVASGTYTPPTETKTAEKLQKLFDKAEEKLAKDCGLVQTAGLIESMSACSGSTTVADLSACVIGEGYGYGAHVAALAYGEKATVLSNADSVQAAADAAADGTKLLLRSGTYAQSVFLDRGNLEFVGCGSAQDERPLFVPASAGDTNGFNATSAPPQLPLENLIFQSIAFGEVGNAWAENGIFVSGADKLLMRDLTGEGDRSSVYLVYPVKSTNVMVETTDAKSTTDAGVYIGQTVDCEARFNKAWDHPAAIEIENSGRCDVHNNIAYENTAGLLVFKLTSPDLQISRDHDIHHNYIAENNIPNHCHGGAVCNAVPGTGIMTISDRFTQYRYNEIRDNRSVGLLMIDQETVNVFVAAGTFDPVSDPQALEGNCFRNNYLFNNGYNSDSGIPAGLEGQALILPLGGLTNPAYTNGWFDNITVQPSYTSTLPSTCIDPETVQPPPPPYPDPLFPSTVGAFVDGPVLF
jgi:parallel beta-helix repeat protein